MGNCFSSNQAKGQRVRQVQIGQPQNPTLHVPRRRMDDQGAELQIIDQELTRRNLERALQYVAGYLDQKRQRLTIVTVGGVINTIYLRSRQTTHDVDFFGSHLSRPQLVMIDEAMQYAERMSSVPLGGGWLNNETQLHMAPDVREYVTQHALEQNTVVFEAPGLIAVAAPWSYCFISKSSRLGTQWERPYDLDDAVIYLHEWNRGMRDDVASHRMFRDLCARYRRSMLSARC